MNTENKYRLDIDGLRAIAVLSVIFFHTKVPFFKGGFVGVDVFFVISGYLISSNIFKDLERHNFSFLNFYSKRIRRIFPALFFILGVCTIGALFLSTHYGFNLYGQSLAASGVFASNFFFWKNTGYFDTSSQEYALLHTWSLAIEEQFYIFFPIIVFFLFKYDRLKFGLVLLFMLSLMGSIFGGKMYPTFSFYLLPTRAWELLAGSILALRIFPKTTSKVSSFLSIAGLILIGVAVFLFTEETVFPSYNALIPVIGSVLLIYTGQYFNGSIHKLLSLPFLVFIGKISYSLYLWHWIVLHFYNKLFWEETLYSIVVILCLSFLLSFLSWKFIEQPFRHFKHTKITSVRVIGLGILLQLSVLCVGFYIGNNAFPNWFPESERKRILDGQGHVIELQGKYRLFGDTTKIPKTLFWGDSHSLRLGLALDSSFKSRGKSIAAINLSGTPVVLGVTTKNDVQKYRELSKLNRKQLNVIQSHPEIKTIVLQCRWYAYLKGDYSLVSEVDSLRNLTQIELLEIGLRGVIHEIRKLDKKVIILTEIPNLGASLEKILVKKRILGISTTPTREEYYKRNKEVLKLFYMLEKEGLVTIIPIHERFFREGKVSIEKNKRLLYIDDNHISCHAGSVIEDLFRGF